MKIIKIDNKNNLIEEAKKYLSSNVKDSICFYVVTEKKFVALPLKKDYNLNKIKELKYDFEQLNYLGGTIVCEQGDLEIAYYDTKYNLFKDKFKNYFIKWLLEKGIKAEFKDNDILIDGFKACGISFQSFFKGINVTLIHIGVNTNLENIKKICNKKMIKIPKGLSEYGITSEEVEQMFLDFCNNY